MNDNFSTMTFKTGILLILLFLIAVTSCQNPTSNAGALTTVSIRDTVVNIGIIKYGEVQKVQFKIENNGDAPLLIKHVEPGCGCTKVDWSKKPTKKGNEATISVEFDGKAFGFFRKDIEVFMNTVEGSKRLYFKGEAVEN